MDTHIKVQNTWEGGKGFVELHAIMYWSNNWYENVMRIRYSN